MPRIISFADGFASATSPLVGGSSQENYGLLNNQTSTDITGLLIDSSLYKSAFGTMEVERIGSSVFRQTIQFQLVFDGTDWLLTNGNSTGSDIVNDTISSEEMVSFSVDSSGQWSYSSGDLTGFTSSTLKLNITKVTV